MVVNRVGDLGLSVGIFLIFFFFGTVDFLTIFALSNSVLQGSINFFNYNIIVADLIAFFLFFGVIGKSAQFGLHA